MARLCKHRVLKTCSPVGTVSSTATREAHGIGRNNPGIPGTQEP